MTHYLQTPLHWLTYNMAHCKGLDFITRKRPTPTWLFKTLFLALIMFAGVTCEEEDQTDPEPDAAFPCISDCATCAVICSPPLPAPSESHSPPPPAPPQTYYTPFSPPPSSPPPQPPPPKRSPSQTASPPPSPPAWYYIWGESPPPPYKSNAPPSGPGVNVLTPTGTGPLSYSSPYDHFYSSDASCISASTLCFFFFFQFLLSCWCLVE